MKPPFGMDVAKRLKEKGYISESHLSKFKKIHDDIGKAQKMAEGGVVDEPQNVKLAQWLSTMPAGVTPAAPSPSKASQAAPDTGKARKMADGGMVDEAPTPDETASSLSQLTVPDSVVGAVKNAYNTLPFMPGATAQEQPAPQEAPAPSPQPMQDMQQFGTEGPQQQPPATMKLASDTPDKTGMQVPEYNPMGDAMQGMNSAYDMQAQGVATQLKAAQAKGSEEAAQYQNTAKKLADSEAARQDYVAKQTDYMNGKQAELDDLNDKYSKMKIDPDRYWNNKSTPDKVMAGIGMILGSFGSSSTNQVVDQMHRAIQQDLEAQSHDIQTAGQGIRQKQSLFADMFNIYKNKEAAMAASTVSIMNQTQLQLNAIASRYSSPEAQGKAQQLYGQIELQKQQAQMQLNQSVMKMYALQNPEQYKEFLEPNQRERIVPGYKGLATQPAVAKELIDASSANKSVQDNADALIKIANMPGASLTPELIKEAKVRYNALQGQIAKSEYSRTTENELNQVADAVADPTKMFSLRSSILKSLNTVKDVAKENIDNKAKAAGLIPYAEANGLKTSSEMPKPMGGMIPTSARK